MVLPVDEILRDQRTGILAEPAELLRAMLKQDAEDRGVRGHYDLCRAVNALVRVNLHLLARVQALEAGLALPTPRATASEVRIGGRAAPLPPVKDRTTWKPAAQLDDGEQETLGETRHRALATLPHVLDGVLRSAPERWWTAREVLARIVAESLWPGTLTGATVGQFLVRHARRLGWRQRDLPGSVHRIQYSIAGQDLGGST